MRSANGGDISTERESSDSSATSSEVCPANEEVEADVGGAVPAEQDGEGGGEDLEGDIDGFVLSHVRLPQGRTVPNCCAVCLCPYEDGDSLVFSSFADAKKGDRLQDILSTSSHPVLNSLTDTEIFATSFAAFATGQASFAPTSPGTSAAVIGNDDIAHRIY